MFLNRIVRSPSNSLVSSRVLRASYTAIAETAGSALNKSCYLKIDFKVPEEAPVYDAIQRMAAHNIGCLAVTEGDGSSGRVVILPFN